MVLTMYTNIQKLIIISCLIAVSILSGMIFTGCMNDSALTSQSNSPVAKTELARLRQICLEQEKEIADLKDQLKLDFRLIVYAGIGLIAGGFAVGILLKHLVGSIAMCGAGSLAIGFERMYNMYPEYLIYFPMFIITCCVIYASAIGIMAFLDWRKSRVLKTVVKAGENMSIAGKEELKKNIVAVVGEDKENYTKPIIDKIKEKIKNDKKSTA